MSNNALAIVVLLAMLFVKDNQWWGVYGLLAGTIIWALVTR